MEFSEGTDVDVEEDFVEICDIELPDDDVVQYETKFCVICNYVATEQQPPQFLVHVYCGQTARWINMLLGTEVGLSAGDIVLDKRTVQIAKRFESSTVLWAFHTIQPSSLFFTTFLFLKTLEK